MTATIVIGDEPRDGDAPTWSEGMLRLTVSPDPDCGLHVGPRIVCLLEGVLFACRLTGEQVIPPTDARSAAGWLAKAYARAGRGVLPRLRGEYWALLWDRQRAEGVVVCDHLGTRGPYFTRQSRGLVLASELPELLRALPRTPPPDPLTLAHWLMRTLAPDGRTLYAGVRRLPAAHLLALGDTTAQPWRYWEPTYRPPRRPRHEVLVEEVRKALDLAVRRRLHASKSVGHPGVLLSGGLDSSAVAALAASVAPDLATYSATFPAHPEIDETALIDRTTSTLGLASTRMLVESGSVLAGAARFLDAWRSPPATPNLFFWIPLLDRAASDGITVMLDGEGGDEVFGFSPYLLADRLRHGQIRAAVDLAVRWSGSSTPPPREVVLARLRRAGARAGMPGAAHQLMRAMRSLGTYAPAWLPRDLASAWLGTELDPFAYKRAGFPRWWSYLVHAITRANGPALVYEQARRRAAMAGLRASHPLVDVDLVELMLGYDPELSFDRPFTRPLLRDALAGRLDDAVRLRRGKSYFDAIFHDSLAGPDRPRVAELLDPRQAELGAYINLEALHSELFGQTPDCHPEGLLGWALTAWRAVTAELWLRQQAHRSLDIPSGLREGRFELRRAGNLTNATDKP